MLFLALSVIMASDRIDVDNMSFKKRQVSGIHKRGTVLKTPFLPDISFIGS